MKYWKRAIATTTLILSASVNAAFIDNGSYTTDDVSGLDWLDLSITDGQSYNGALISNPSWRYATKTEIENMFSILFDGFYITGYAGESDSSYGAYADQYEDVINFQRLFGITYQDSSMNKSYGVYSNDQGFFRRLGTYTLNDITVVYGPEDTIGFDRTFYDRGINEYGVYMVRNSVVPVPAAVWLFGSGLIGLIGVARRKKA